MAKTQEARDFVSESRKAVYDIFLTKLNGNRIAEVPGPNQSRLEWWQVRGNLVVVQLWKDGGWEYYLQGGSGRVAEIAQDVQDYFRVTFGTQLKE